MGGVNNFGDYDKTIELYDTSSDIWKPLLYYADTPEDDLSMTHDALTI